MSQATAILPPSAQSKKQGANLWLLGELIEHYRIIVITTVFFTLAALIYALSAPPIYQANALIQIEQKQGNALLNNLSQILPETHPQSTAESVLLKSRMVLGKTVDDLHLQIQIEPRYMPLIGYALEKIRNKRLGNLVISELRLPIASGEMAEGTLTVLSKEQYRLTGSDYELKGRVGELLHKDGVSILVETIDAAPGSQFTITWSSRLKAIADLQEAFSVTDQGKDTGMLSLTLTGENPQLLTPVLETISNNYLAQNISRQEAIDTKSLEFLNAQIPQILSNLDTAEDKLNVYRKMKDSVDLNMEAKSVLDQIANIENQINELAFSEAEVSQLYKKDHPSYRTLMEKRDMLQKEKVRLNKRISTMPSTQQEVLRLSRNVDSGRAVYLQLLNRQQELNIARSSAIGNVRIIDNAITLIKPVKPKKMLVVLIGFMFGGFLSIGLVLLKVMLRQGIESPEQLEEVGISVYACVPHSEWLTKKKHLTPNMLLAVKNPVEPAIEAIRGLRTSMHFAMMEAKNNVLMISGISPGSGKTFISSNFAVILTQIQKRVLFIDADMRKGHAHDLFGLMENRGLSEILSGKCTPEQAIVTLPEVGFDCISRGKAPPNPAELLMHPEFKMLIESVSRHYDLIIIDTPPIMAVTDATIIGRLAGTVLIVVQFEVNTIKESIAGIRRFEQSGIPVKGCILNGVKNRASNYYYYGYGSTDSKISKT